MLTLGHFGLPYSCNLTLLRTKTHVKHTSILYYLNTMYIFALNIYIMNA